MPTRKLLKTSYEVVIEQEPGSGGKESAENTIRMLAGMKVTADKVTGSGGIDLVLVFPGRPRLAFVEERLHKITRQQADIVGLDTGQ
jgi:hypothetical protein